jgi:eukaryotic-like serine/threonine-protein kinase
MLERFRREVKLARKVTHVNVARTFDIGEDGGDRFLTMELIEGEPLSVLSSRARMPLGRVLAIAREVLEGLAASHDAGVVHGDLKPENVICSKAGRIVITDFGIARALALDPDADRTATGMLVGTPQYMAPEQVEGTGDLDGRADIYALGCMLFRLITGEPAWSGTSYVTIAAARLLRDPPDPAQHLPELASEVRAFVLKCMARDRSDRYPDARAASAALALAMAHATDRPTTSTAVVSRPPPTQVDSLPPARSTRTVAVLPLQNQGSADDAYLAAGLTDDLIDILSGVSQLRVRPRGAVAAFARPDRDAREAGRTLGVDAVVDGSLRRAGDLLRVTLRLVTVADGFQLWAKRFDRPSADFLAVGDAAAAEVAEVLTSEKVAPPREAPTDAAALDLYLRGRFIFTRAYFDVAEAVGLLRAAHERAPNDGRITAAYALALMRHHHIAVLPNTVAEEARALAAKAIETDASIPEAHVAIALVHLSQLEPRSGAVALKRALEVAPRSIDALIWMGNILLECDRVDRAAEMFQAVLAEDDGVRLAHGHLARIHALRGDWAASDEALVHMNAGNDVLYWMLTTRFAIWRGDPEHARRLRGRIESAELPGVMKDRLRAMLAVASGGEMTREARDVLAAEAPIAGAPRRSALNAQIRIEVYTRGGLIDAALQQYPTLEEAAFIDLGWLDRCPVLEPLRNSAEHRALRKSVTIRVDRILDALDSGASGLRLRAG